VTRAVVIGVGNDYRRDDAAGLAVARRVRALAPDDVAVVERDGEPAGLIDAWAGAAIAFVVDAARSGAEPGTVHRLESGAQLPSSSRHASSHAFAVGEAVALARAVDLSPRRLVMIGIEGADFRMGTGLTQAVAAAVDDVAASVLAELREAVLDTLSGPRNNR
jgi:hydrogenase maturation protease